MALWSVGDLQPAVCRAAAGGRVCGRRAGTGGRGAAAGRGFGAHCLSLLIPLARRSLVAAAVLSFLHTVGEFGVVLMLGGDIPGATRTLSIVLYNQVENFDYAAANRTAAILLGLSMVGARGHLLEGQMRGGRRA